VLYGWGSTKCIFSLNLCEALAAGGFVISGPFCNKGTVRPCTGTEALYRPYGARGSRGIALPFHDNGTRRGEGSASRPSRSLPSGKTQYPLYRRLIGPQGRSGEVRKIPPPTGIRSPDCPARSLSLYRLSYRAHPVL
jgi:hypothetical protein